MIIPENVQPYIRKMQHYGPGLLTNTTYERLNPTGTWKIIYPASSDESLVEPALYLQHEYTKIMLWLFPIKMKHYRWIHEDDIVFRTERRDMPWLHGHGDRMGMGCATVGGSAPMNRTEQDND